MMPRTDAAAAAAATGAQSSIISGARAVAEASGNGPPPGGRTTTDPASMPRLVSLVGVTPRGLHQRCLGVYELVRTSSSAGRLAGRAGGPPTCRAARQRRSRQARRSYHAMVRSVMGLGVATRANSDRSGRRISAADQNAASPDLVRPGAWRVATHTSRDRDQGGGGADAAAAAVSGAGVATRRLAEAGRMRLSWSASGLSSNHASMVGAGTVETVGLSWVCIVLRARVLSCGAVG